jgi:hypothetical protein
MRLPGVPATVRLALRLAFCLAVAVGLNAMPARAQFDGNFALERHTLDAENFLDWKAYQYPAPWRDEGSMAPNVFRGTVGSLSQKKFYLHQEIRLEKELGRYATVLYRQEEESFFRTGPIYQEIEFRFGRTFYGSIIGFPRHEKVEGHQGYALAWGERTEGSYLRLSRLKQYILFNQEGTSNQLYDDNPVLERLEGRWLRAGSVSLQVDLRNERPARLLSFSAERQETYEGRKGDLVLDVHWSDRLQTGVHLNGNREKRGRYRLFAGAPDATQTLRWGVGDAYAVYRWDEGDEIEAGALRGLFENRIAAAQENEGLEHRLASDALYALWSHPTSGSFAWLFSVQVGRVELRTLDGAGRLATEDGRSTELKLGVGGVLQEAGSYRAFFNTTWDLDLIGHRQWDGGNVQLQFLF